jgi:hypothetical protein
VRHLTVTQLLGGDSTAEDEGANGDPKGVPSNKQAGSGAGD